MPALRSVRRLLAAGVHITYCLRMAGNARKRGGWSALSRASWKEARAAFERELAEAGESAAALEGLSWAAWWLDDAGVVFGARERAYLRYKKEGDLAGAARMATWLA